MKAFKLLRIRKDGTLGPLFINKTQRIPKGKWLKAECHPTPGFAIRPGWHTTHSPNAPHLKKTNRVWAEVEIKNFKKFQRPEKQGGLWFIAQKMRLTGKIWEAV